MTSEISEIRTFKEDKEIGKGAEIVLKDRISKYFNDDLIHVKNEFSKFDFRGKKYKYELKHRLLLSTAHDETMIPTSKAGPNTYFLFHFAFDDRLFYIKYDKEAFKNIRIAKFGRAPRPDHIDIRKDHFYIKMDRLTEII